VKKTVVVPEPLKKFKRIYMAKNYKIVLTIMILRKFKIWLYWTIVYLEFFVVRLSESASLQRGYKVPLNTKAGKECYLLYVSSI
jgi:hypothetical protein